MGRSVPELVLALSSLLVEVNPGFCSTYVAGETSNRRWLAPQLLLQRCCIVSSTSGTKTRDDNMGLCSGSGQWDG